LGRWNWQLLDNDLLLTLLLAALVIVGVAFTVFWAWHWMAVARRRGQGAAVEVGSETGAPSILQTIIGFVTDFFDTLGIGSYATTTGLFKALKQCPDRLIPGTLTIGHAIPTFLQAWIYTQDVKVDPVTLVVMIVAAVAGAFLGSGIVAKWPVRSVRLGMGSALAIAAIILCYRLLSEGDASGSFELTGVYLVAGALGNFVLGALMTIGVGAYAPCMILVTVLGMETKAAFPIMMGSCAFLMPVAGVRFMKEHSYSPKAALGLAIGGLPAVWIAAKWVEEMDLTTMKWLVVVVVSITAFSMLRAARRQRAA
jgi:uncharacterized membrane protein YfcA